MKHLKLFYLALLAFPVFTACSDDDSTPPPPPAPIPTAETAIVLNQGSMYYGISSSMDMLNISTNVYTPNVFSTLNGIALGDNAIDAVTHGSKIYVAMYGSNLVWVLHRETLGIIRQIATSDPEGICADGGYVYVSNNNGHVSRIDTTSLEVDKQLAVGPNPCHLTVANNHLYVSISDGYNYDGGYTNGYRVAKVNLSTFEKAKDIRVGCNPGPICADESGRVFVVSRGNYADIQPTLYRIDTNDTAQQLFPATHIAIKGNLLYVMLNHTDWNANPAVTTLDFFTYNTQTEERSASLVDEENKPASAIDIDVDPLHGDFYVGSNASAFDYTSPGYIYRYASDGSLKYKYSAGTAPCAVIFK